MLSRPGFTPLHYACCRGDTDILKLLLAHPNIDVNIQNDEGTPLHYACEGRRGTEIVKELLARPEIDINLKNEREETPLHYACEYDETEIVELLLAHPEIDPNLKNKWGSTSLDIACEEGHTEIKTLLKDFIKKKEQQVTEDFCLAMIQPDLPVSTMSRKRKAKELRRDKLRLGSDLIKSIATYLEWKDISKKSCFEVMKKKKLIASD